MKYFKLPDLGEGLPEAEIVEWHIQVGETIKTDQLLVSVETAKAIVEVPSPQTGKIAALFGKPGDIIHTGEPLVEYADEEQEDSGTVVGKMERASEEVQEDNFIIGHPNRHSPSTSPSPTHSSSPDTSSTHYAATPATPAIRALAQRLHVDLSQVQGTGPNGVITSDDVERARSLENAKGTATPLKGVRRSMAKNMSRAHDEVVQVTIYEEADIHKWKADADPTLRLIRAIGVACEAEPKMNAWFDGKNLSYRMIDHIDLGVAVDTPDGLFVPVLRDITDRSAKNLRKGLDALRKDIRNRTIPPKELQGATITLSNFGTIAGKFASPIVVPPQVAIIGAGVIRPQPVAYKGASVIHPILPISVSFDHRLITGGEAARFLNGLIEDLQKKK